ncbi:MAG: hypothetical protein A3F72_18500 [Bacteroidetes bacterium RIFCSPLOWO2_12_FULL_35_15]|nr:MAG: hypothetical protein A3F72_18500 [Bacteroidetes bacterium RIFCSPLOWO2_12_FULL_35_15]
MKPKIIVFLILVSSTVFAQVPGYMGKRFVIGYENYFFPAFYGPGKNNANPGPSFSPGFNTTHCLNIDYTVKQRMNVCFSLQHLRTGIAYKGDDYAYPKESKYSGNFSTPAQLTSNNIGFGFKVFRRGNIAPVGKYQKFEILLFFEKVKYENNNFTTHEQNYYENVPITLGTGEYTYRNFAITYSLGKQRIFFNKLVMDYGIRAAITPVVIPTGLYTVDNVRDMDDRFKVDSRFRIFRQQLFNFHIGLGFLAF